MCWTNYFQTEFWQVSVYQLSGGRKQNVGVFKDVLQGRMVVLFEFPFRQVMMFKNSSYGNVDHHNFTSICCVKVIPIVSRTKVTKGDHPANLNGNLLITATPQAIVASLISKVSCTNLIGWMGGSAISVRTSSGGSLY